MFPYHSSPEAVGLPVLQIADAVNGQLREHSALVVTAPPGAGKSTLLPLTILEDFERRGVEGRILMLEPRRLAARQIAERMASMMQEPVGQTVGYRVRFENRVSAMTRIEVLTEGILTRMLVDDPTLEGVACVIFDEYHERSLNADLAMALTRETQSLLRPDLRMVVMSATIDTTSLCEALHAPLVESEGRMFPVEIRYSDEEVASCVRRSLVEHEGDILVFLPGEAEIARVAEQLTAGHAQAAVNICPLYSRLTPQEQRRAIAPSRQDERKVVLATSIAETSLTIEGIRVVIDSGLCRTMRFDAATGLSHLETVQISMDMANQRAGRAGRVAAGVCYRLWTLATLHRMAENRQPEILTADLTPMALDIACFGESHPERLPWITPPPAASLAKGIGLLQLLGAIDDRQRITPQGRRLAQLPCHPRIAQMFVMAENDAEKSLAASLAALLEEGGKSESAASRHRIERTAEQYRRIAKVQVPAAKVDWADFAVGKLLAYAYPERIGKTQQEGSGRYRLACGDEAFVARTEEIAAFDWIVAASLNAKGSNGAGGSGRIFLAAPFDPADVPTLVRQRANLMWDGKRGTIVAQNERRIGMLLVDAKPMPLSPSLRGEIQQIICAAAHKEGTSMLDFNEKVENLQQRVAAVASWHPELGLPDFSTESVLQHAEEWLPFFLDKATTTAELKKIDLCAALWGWLDYGQQQAIDRLAPSHIRVPSGNRIRVEYRQGAEAPVLRVRLQECFGMTDTPCVDEGRRPVLMELLSPGFKPVQLTSDLANFWRETYYEVRKELRRRYPKHAWPEEPNPSKS